MKTYAHIILKEGKILAIHLNNEQASGSQLLQAHPAGSTNTTVEHLETTHTYEIKSGSISVVTMQNIYDRMNDPDDDTVTIPS
jgi:hypothetical protein